MSDDTAPAAGQQGYSVRDHEEAIERERLGHLAAARDPKTFEVLGRTGVSDGWHCLELGAGAGTVSHWLAEQVGESGRVMSTDVDLRFHIDASPNMIVRRHDITTDSLPAEHFDLVHARAVLQHLPEREDVVDKLVAALKPGGWMVLEDGNFLAFAEQTLAEPYATLHRIIAEGTTTQWRDPNYALRLLDELRRRGFTDLDVVGDVWAMRPGESGGEWWFLAVEGAGARLIEVGLITPGQLEDAMAQVRDPEFVMMSSLSIAVSGRKPL